MAAKPDFQNLANQRNQLRVGRAEEASATTKSLLHPEFAVSTRVLIEDLTENPYNSRVVYLPEQIEDKAQSMLLSGQATPILVAQMPGGKQVVIDGWTRTLASRKIVADSSISAEVREKFATIEAVVRSDLTSAQLASLSYVANEEHKGLRDIDRAFAFHRALEAGVFENQEKLAESYRVDRTVVTKLRSIASAPEPVLELIKAHPDKLTYSFVTEVLSSGLRTAKQCELLKETVEGNRSVAWLRGQVIAAAGRSATRTQLEELRIEGSTIKWSPAPRAKTIEVTVRSKAEQLSMVQLLTGIFAHSPAFREQLIEALADENFVAEVAERPNGVSR